MDGDSFDIGSVAYLHKHRRAITIARYIMYYTSHTLLVGSGADDFADQMHIPMEYTTNNNTIDQYEIWKRNNCQPNYYDNLPMATSTCPPYDVTPFTHWHHTYTQSLWKTDHNNHDTIGIVAGINGSLACGTSTNGANHKINGRVGDSPLPGSGCYVNSAIGGAAATGDGDIMLRFLPSYTAVLYMEQGYSVQAACDAAFARIAAKFPTFSGGMVCIDRHGEHAGVAYNMEFAYSYMGQGQREVTRVEVAAKR